MEFGIANKNNRKILLLTDNCPHSSDTGQFKKNKFCFIICQHLSKTAANGSEAYTQF